MKIMPPHIVQQYFKLISCVLCLVMLSAETYADNGAVATAVPVSGIVVDGDLSDWPTSLKDYPIAYPERGDVPKSAEDLQASFRIGYNQEEQLLYVAVLVRDECLVLKGSKGDGCEVFIQNAVWQIGDRLVFRFAQFDDSTRSVLSPLDRYLVTQDIVAVTTTKPDKYDRYLADVFYLAEEEDAGVVLAEGRFLNRALCEAGVAVPFREGG